MSLTLVILLLAALETAWAIRDFHWGDTPGIDLEIYLGATSRLLAGDAWFLDRQLGGPYIIRMGDVLYPPVAALFFAPFLVLPAILWWALPIGFTAVQIRRWRPAPWTWPLMALCVLWPLTPAKTITGNPALWMMAFVAAGLRWRWPAALVLLKPSLFPFAVIGRFSRGWWIVVVGLAAGSLLWLDATLTWIKVLLDSRGGGLLYSAVDAPMLLIPVLAWLGRDSSQETLLPAIRPVRPSDPDPELTVVLPAYNEARRIGPALDELFAFIDGHGWERTRVLVVDDGSTDGTGDLVRARPEAARHDGRPARLGLLVVPHAGKGAAVRAGMLATETAVAIYADADMATPPDMLPVVLKALEDHDVALGSRIQPDGTDARSSQPRLRRLLGMAFHLLASAVVGGVPDTQCGFKGFRRDAALDLFERQRLTGIAFDVEVIHLARRRGYRIAIVPVRWADRRGSRMRPGPALASGVAWDVLRVPFLHRHVGRRTTVSATRAVRTGAPDQP